MSDKCCFVPRCKNTTHCTPEKLFVNVPSDENKRQKWFKYARRKMTTGRNLHCCEDHFELTSDMKNYWQVMLMKNTRFCPKNLLLKPGVVPHKFECQQEDKVKMHERESSKLRSKRKEVQNILYGKISDMKTDLYTASSDVNNCEFKVGSEKKPKFTAYTEVKNESEDEDNSSIKVEIKTETFEDVPFDDGDIAYIDNLNRSRNDHLQMEETSNSAAHSETHSNKVIDDEPLDSICSFKSMEEVGINDGHILTVAEPFPCDLESYKTKDSKTPKIHVLNHTAGRPLSCELCSYKAMQRSHLKRHILKHTEKPFSCKFCTYKARKFTTLERHILTHTAEKPLSCEFCSYKTSHCKNLKRHILTHTGEHPYSCDLCSYEAKDSTSMKNHVLIHTGEKPFSCELCPYKARQNAHLQRHLLSHTGEKPVSCEFCSYQATESTAMKRHILYTHTEEKPFSCDLCSYKAKENRTLKRHILTHTGKNPFSCDLCSYKTKDSTALKNYVLIHVEKNLSQVKCVHIKQGKVHT